MASQFDSWESYFYPDTIDPDTGIGTLRNLYDERDARVLARMEYTDTTVRAVQLGNGEVDVPRTFDGEHLRAIHRHRHGCREPIARATVLVELLVTFTHISHKPTALLIRRRQCRCQRCETHGSTHRSIPIPCCVSDESRQFGGTPRCRLSRNTCRLARSGEPVKGSP